MKQVAERIRRRHGRKNAGGVAQPEMIMQHTKVAVVASSILPINVLSFILEP
jgi:hypothetical protein